MSSDWRVTGTSKPEYVEYNISEPLPARYQYEDELGEEVTHVYDVKNRGPSAIQEADVFIMWPSFNDGGDHLLYLLGVDYDRSRVQCKSIPNINPLYVKTVGSRGYSSAVSAAAANNGGGAAAAGSGSSYSAGGSSYSTSSRSGGGGGGSGGFSRTRASSTSFEARGGNQQQGSTYYERNEGGYSAGGNSRESQYGAGAAGKRGSHSQVCGISYMHRFHGTGGEGERRGSGSSDSGWVRQPDGTVSRSWSSWSSSSSSGSGGAGSSGSGRVVASSGAEDEGTR